MHWLDEVVETLRREAGKWRASHGGKAEAHDTAADL